MRTHIACSAIAAIVALGVFVPRGSSAPALGEKLVKYEYAELRDARIIVGQKGMGMAAMGGGVGLGLPGGALAGGNPAVAQTSIHWETAQEELVTKDWEELADKLKAPAPKKESPVTVHKLWVLNALAADGWELLDRPSGDGNSTWSFRRPVR